jgi:hypothetical protein
MQKNVLMVAPFTTRDLAQRSIADVIFDLQARFKKKSNKIPLFRKRKKNEENEKSFQSVEKIRKNPTKSPFIRKKE